MNGGLWMMKDGGKDLEGRTWRKGVGKSSRGEFEEAGARIMDMKREELERGSEKEKVGWMELP
jgi:hypothetical protein